MVNLNVGGLRVKVDDSFLKLSTEQQNATVDEIVASQPYQDRLRLYRLEEGIRRAHAAGNAEHVRILGTAYRQMQAEQGYGNAAASPEYNEALASASKASNVFNRPEPAGRPDLMGATAATIGGVVNGIPVIGPMAQGISDNLVGMGSQFMGGSFEEGRDGARARREQLAEANPVANIAGNLSGGIGAYGALAKTAGGAAALGLEGSLGARIGNSAVSGASISAADAAAKGGSANEILTSATYGGAIGAVTPPITSGLGMAARAIGNKFAPALASATNPTEEAARRAGQAVLRDRGINPAGVMSAADEVVARQSGVPLMNVDRGGETTRALARSVANQSPEARSMIERVANDRFEAQGNRAIEFVRRLTGSNADDLALQNRIKLAAQMTNGPRYKAAMEAPQSQWVFTADLQELMQSPSVQRAISMTQQRGKDLAAIAGDMPVQNPFRQGRDGVWRIVQQANGTLAAPNLRFWDQVKRNLDGMIGVAQRGGDKTELSVLTQIKNKLVGSLDATVPQYRTARQGAAAFFDADDALDAGRKFAGQPRNVPEAKRAFAAFNDTEKQAFQTGYASELIDRIRSTRDRVNVINQVFGNQSSREMAELVFGKAKAQQLEAYVRVENLADMVRSAMGNSTTTRQLVELGIGTGVGGIGGFTLSGGNMGSALQGAALGAGAAGIRSLGQRVDSNVMKEVARILTSSDPKDLQKAIFNASMSPKWMDAIRSLEQQLQIGTRAVAMPGGQ